MTENDTDNTSTGRFEVWCQYGHKSIIERVDWPNDDTPPYNCPVCTEAVRYEELDEGHKHK